MSQPRRTPALPPELPGFTFDRHLGSGGFSDVFLYEQHLPRRKVAVKVLLGGDELEDTSRQAFIGEANLMARLSSHPYIVTIFHADVARDGRPYFVMEYAAGRSLAERYRTDRIAVDEVLRTGVRIASAVATAHAGGVLHRDIKPANVLTNEFGWPALTDFGISSAVDDELAEVAGDVERTAPGLGSSGATSQRVGMSVPWSPPEMFEDEPQPDVRSDVFSLGATVFSLVAGRTPFEVPSGRNGTIDLIARIQRGAIGPIQRHDVPPSLVAVLHRSMARRPEDRYATAVEFARALQRVELELGYSPTAIDVPSLVVAAPVRQPGSGESVGDETIARGPLEAEARVAGAPSTGGIAITHGGGARASAEERTATRNIVRVAAQREAETDAAAPAPARGAASPSAASPPSASPPQSRRNLVVGLVAGAAALVLVAIAVLGWVFGAPDTAQSGPTSPATASTPLPVPAPPSPVAPSVVRAEDGTVTFTWMNPDERPGDVYYWKLADGSAPGSTTTSTSVTIGPYPVDARVCISVEIRRSGMVSPKPLVSCYPQ